MVRCTKRISLFFPYKPSSFLTLNTQLQVIIVFYSEELCVRDPGFVTL